MTSENKTPAEQGKMLGRRLVTYDCHRCKKNFLGGQAVKKSHYHEGQQKMKNHYYCPVCGKKIYQKVSA